MNLFTYKLNEFKNISGIYKITCTSTGKFYIGSAKDIQHRLARHKSDLGRNVHHNILLQRAVDKYGKDVFEFEILEFVDDTESLIQREQHYLDTLNPCDISVGFNLVAIAGATPSGPLSEETKAKISKTLTGRKHTEDTKLKMSGAHKGKKLSEEHYNKWQAGKAKYIEKYGHPLLGKKKSKESIEKWRESIKDYKITEETRAKMSLKQKGSNNPSAKLDDNKVVAILEIHKLKTYKVQEIADLFNVSLSAIENIIYNKTWKHIPRD